MHAVVIRETGGPEVLRLEQVERPEPQDGEVLIRVNAVGVNAVDWKFRRGDLEKQLPAILGSDVSGTVEASPPSQREMRSSVLRAQVPTPSSPWLKRW